MYSKCLEDYIDFCLLGGTMTEISKHSLKYTL